MTTIKAKCQLYSVPRLLTVHICTQRFVFEFLLHPTFVTNVYSLASFKGGMFIAYGLWWEMPLDLHDRFNKTDVR